MDDDQLLRYSRQIMLPQVDAEGQSRLLDARVLIIGLGGLGSPAAMYLAAAGVGNLIINDFDTVDLSNLQRQIAHTSDAIGMAKVDSAKRTLLQLNPNIQIQAINQALAPQELDLAVDACDVILDCSDNFATRFQINRASVHAQKPLISGAVIRFEAQLTSFDPKSSESPCYQCLYACDGELEESCVRNGVIAPLTGMVGSMQALEAIKLILGIGTPLIGRLLLFDALSMEWSMMRFKKHPDCPVCNA